MLPEAHLIFNGQNISIVNHVKCLGVIFDKSITWRLHTDMTEAKALRIRTYSLFKSESLSANIKLILPKALIRSVMAYACPVWELAADTYLLKLQRLESKVLRPLNSFQGAYWSAICTQLSTFGIYTIIQQNCASDNRDHTKSSE
jgi:hypothetical protein